MIVGYGKKSISLGHHMLACKKEVMKKELLNEQCMGFGECRN